MKRFIRDDSGATAIEYGLIISLIFLVVVASVTAFGEATVQKMNDNSTSIAAAMS